MATVDDVEFAGTGVSYDEGPEEAKLEVKLVNNSGETLDIYHDIQIDVGDNGTFDETKEGWGITVYTEGSEYFYIGIPKSDLPIDIRTCVQITKVE